MLALKPFSPADFSVLASWFSSEREVVQWGGPAVDFPLDARQFQAMLDQSSNDRPSKSCWMAVIGEESVGHAQLAIDWRHGVAALSRVVIAPHARGRRLADKMLRLVICEAFASPIVERVELNVYTWNKAAIGCYARLGFMLEGVRRSSTRVADERWDTAIMALLRHEQ